MRAKDLDNNVPPHHRHIISFSCPWASKLGCTQGILETGCGGGGQGGAAGIEPASAGVPDSDGATSQSLAGVGHSGVWGKCLVDTIGDVVHTWEAVYDYTCNFCSLKPHYMWFMNFKHTEGRNPP